MRGAADKKNLPLQRASRSVAPSRSASPSISHPVRSILQLQRRAGNQIVQRLLHANTEGPETVSDVKPQRGGVNPPGNPSERQADRVAEQMMYRQEPWLQREAPRAEVGPVMKRDGTAAALLPSLPGQGFHSSGRPLDAEARAFMEPRFGHDFSDVRVHTDSRAAESAKGLHARAYTLGNQIVFGAEEYAPEQPEGRRLLAHELTHIVQQRQAAAPRLQLQPAPPQPLGPIGQARADCESALRRTAERVRHAITARDGIGIVPHDVDAALTRFFRGTTYQSFEALLSRIEPMIGWIGAIPAQHIPTPVPPGTPHARQHTFNIGRISAFSVSAPDFPPPNFIALYDDWFAAPNLQAPTFLHEAYHFSFPTLRGHNPNDPWTNPYAYQGFVSILGGLTLGSEVNNQFPP